MAIESQTGSYNLYAGADVYTKVAAADAQWGFRVRATVNTALSVITATYTIGSSWYGTETITKPAGHTAIGFKIPSYMVDNGETVTLNLQSSNAADTNVTVTVTPWVAQADLRRINGLLCDGTPAVGSRPNLSIGQFKMECSIASEGAMHAVNAAAYGYGQYNQGNLDGQYNQGGYSGQRNYGDVGQWNQGHTANGQYNLGVTNGQYNDGEYYGQRNEGDTGQYNDGEYYGQYNEGGTADVLLAGTGKIVDISGNNVVSVGVDASTTAANVGTLLARIGAWTGTGINTILGAFRAICGKKAALTPTDLTADSVTFNNVTDSLEAQQEAAVTIAAAATAAQAAAEAIKADVDDGGRTDLLIDAILEDTGTTLDDLLDTLVARLTADRAAKLDYLDASISSRHTAGAAVAKSPATLAAGDVTGNLPADVKAWNGGALPTIGTSTLDAAGVRTAVGLAAADLDTQLGTKALEATAQSILEDTGTTIPAALVSIGVAVAAVPAAVWAVSVRTLSSFGTLASTLATAVWAYTSRTLTQSAQSIADQVSGDSITMHRGDSVTLPLTGLGSLADRTALWFTVKAKAIGDPSDADALIQITEDEGLLRINGTEAATAANASITVDDEDAGDITIRIKPVESAKLIPNSERIYDVQMLDSSGNVSTKSAGKCTITKDVTRATAAPSA